MADNHSSNIVMLPWFWIGAGVGTILSTAAVIIAAEITRKYSRPRTEQEQIEDDLELVEDLTFTLKESLDVLAQATDPLGYSSYAEANQERIRFGLEPGTTGAGSSGWYTSDEDDDNR